MFDPSIEKFILVCHTSYMVSDVSLTSHNITIVDIVGPNNHVKNNCIDFIFQFLLT